MKLNSLDDKISELECGISTDEDDMSSVSDIEIERDKNGNILKFSSVLIKESILPLPSKYLPLPQCTKRKSDNKSQEQVTSSKKRKVVFADDTEEQKKATTIPVKSKNTGLEQTVKEMLKNYVPASQEKLPFYCRVCQFRGQNIDELNQHKMTELHKSAISMEQKLTFCKVCKKQFTSPDQMKEHLKGKAHVERLATLKSKQGKKFY